MGGFGGFMGIKCDGDGGDLVGIGDMGPFAAGAGRIQQRIEK